VILAVCLNPALDITYRTESIRPASSHAVEVVGERAGGKGINVARVLNQMGVPTTVTGLLGGARGTELTVDLDHAGVRHSFSAVAGQNRRAVAVFDDEDATVFNEPGPVVCADEWTNFLDHYWRLLSDAAVVTLSGSIPPGLGTGAYATLIGLARGAGVPVVVDAGGVVLTKALSERPTLVAPNLVEAASALGRAIDGPDDIERAAADLRDLGAENVVISSGPNGLVCRSGAGSWVAKPSHRVSGNPTGAGDALTAALALGLFRGEDWPTMLRTGIGWAAGAVASHCAGEIDEGVAAQVARDSALEELG